MTTPKQLVAVPAASRMSECRSCHQPIYWIRTGTGKLMPVDCETEDGKRPTGVDPGHGVSHFATCPEANAWRKQKGAAP